jgi:hypothetical protein
MTPRRFEYSFGLWTCRLGAHFKSGVNPFTGEEVRFYIDEGLSQAEREATKVLLRDRAAELEGPGEFYRLRFGDGVEVWIGLGTLVNDLTPVIGAKVEIVGRRLTDNVLRFLHELANVANMAFTPAVAGDGPEAITQESIDPVIRQRWPRVVVVRTPAELIDWLEKHVKPRKVI